MTFEYERALHGRGYAAICGIDEAGCGPLAGPVCAAAVILDPDDPIDGVDDSKKLSEKRREELFPRIVARARAYGVAFAAVEEIERLNILQARLLAMRRAVAQLSVSPDFALVDGNRDPQLETETLLVVHGDALVPSIAAASVLAKVSRDRVMRELAEQYPQYGFEKHKGYASAAHRAAILQYGPSPVHRRSFLNNLLGRAE